MTYHAIVIYITLVSYCLKFIKLIYEHRCYRLNILVFFILMIFFTHNYISDSPTPIFYNFNLSWAYLVSMCRSTYLHLTYVSLTYIRLIHLVVPQQPVIWTPPFCKWKDSNILDYNVKTHTKYCNYSILNTIIL